MAETCFCQDSLNLTEPRFKPLLAETCQPWQRQHKDGNQLQPVISNVAQFNLFHTVGAQNCPLKNINWQVSSGKTYLKCWL